VTFPQYLSDESAPDTGSIGLANSLPKQHGSTIVNVFGVIMNTSGNEVEIFTNPNADRDSDYRMEKSS
jgi:hypothetical protein